MRLQNKYLAYSPRVLYTTELLCLPRKIRWITPETLTGGF